MKSATLAWVAVVLAATAGPAAAGDRLEITAFAGASLLHIGRQETLYFPCALLLPPPGGSPIDPFAPPCLPPSTQERRLGGSFLQGTAIGYRITPRASIEGAFSVAPGHRLGGEPFSDEDETVTAYHADAALRYDLGLSEIRPFLTLGAGRAEYGGGQTARDWDGCWSLNLGAGVALRLSDRSFLRAEIVDHVMTHHPFTDDSAHDVHVRLGVMMRP